MWRGSRRASSTVADDDREESMSTLHQSSQLGSVLYVDDEQDIRTIVEMSLGIMSGLVVQCCDSGAGALARMRESLPDLVLLDAMMPEMDGPTVLERMKADPVL